MGGCRLLYLQRAKMARILLFYYVLCQYIHSFIFPEMAGGGGGKPP